ncbi:NAD(P)-dependent alcohol dehydrogenase [Chengkuizengella axinellae]|uniref:NAD(P)-dependent alcohol dehydrogenase n=1 Tax=Chengkuizengella axinellae TaxID=3064388 RepID=A0ABT9IWH0_9BACL|nr:NAD(P)-dependent alcohol dehydrogenase [Chengkuizengella sp. 2205SS18-9]MDP5273714.1 NAD(P)-dependent alcohol dehydrogenase [Chengkuizengella sp. 2205SS18-9]
MRGIVYEKYGAPEVLHIKELRKPTPKQSEVLIKVYTTTVTKGDVRMRSFSVPPFQWLFARMYLGMLKPKRSILGMELAGEIEEVGEHVTKFKVGDMVFASTFEVDFGGYAEYKCIPEDGVLALKPDKLSFGEAAASVGAGMSAIRCLQKSNIQKGQEVLIYGASGAVGSSAVQIATNHYGSIVTAVCSKKNLELAKSLGAEHIVDYTKQDITQLNKKYDVIFDAVDKLPKSKAKKVLKKTGVYLNVHKDTNSSYSKTRVEELLKIRKLMVEDKFKPYIDRVYPMEEIVEAHRYVDLGHKKGNVVIEILR